MREPQQSKDSSSSAASTGAGAGASAGFYLRLRTKIWILAVCITLMIAASVFAVLQPLNPDPSENEKEHFTWFRYPDETNPYARLQAVHCASDGSKDYGCRLNSVAVNGTGNLPEVWAVGNVGLVLHRSAGQTKWEQLTITAKSEVPAGPSPTPTPAPTPTATPIPAKPARPTPTPRTSSVALPTPTPTPTTTPSPTATPTPTTAQMVNVPNLIGHPYSEAVNMLEKSQLRLGTVQNESDKNSNSPAQQGPPPDLRVIQQTPPPGTAVLPGTAVNVTLGVPPKAKVSLLDTLFPTVYASAPDKQPRRVVTPSRVPVRTTVPPTAGMRSASAGRTAPQPVPAFPVTEDDLFTSGALHLHALFWAVAGAFTRYPPVMNGRIRWPHSVIRPARLCKTSLL